MSAMKRVDWEQLLTETVLRHCSELRQLAAENKISEQDHDIVGTMMQKCIPHITQMSETAWATFVRIGAESRKVQQIEHED